MHWGCRRVILGMGLSEYEGVKGFMLGWGTESVVGYDGRGANGVEGVRGYVELKFRLIVLIVFESFSY